MGNAASDFEKLGSTLNDATNVIGNGINSIPGINTEIIGGYTLNPINNMYNTLNYTDKYGNVIINGIDQYGNVVVNNIISNPLSDYVAYEDFGGDVLGGLSLYGGFFGDLFGVPCNQSVRDLSNHCDNLDDTEQSSGFCARNGPDGDTARKAYCADLGGSHEYAYAGAGGGCSFNDRTGNTEMDNCCTGGACGWPGGRKAVCRRKLFNADPLLCCNRDLACNPKPENCFNNTDQTKTCAPEYRNMSTTSCQNLMIDYCTGADLPIGNSQEWINRWIYPQNIGGQVFPSPCYNSIYRNLYNGQATACENPPRPGMGIPTSNGFIYGQNLITKVIERYILDGGDLASSESAETNGQLTNIIKNVCQTTPGLCTNALSAYCVNVTSETLVRNPNLLPWCGCYMSPENYDKYTNLYGISRECTPTCNMAGAIPLASNDGNSYKTCTQNRCIIDDISINIINSTVGNESGGINFSQMCNSCSVGGNSGTCNCTITGGNFDIINSKTGNLSVSQQCSSDSICYKEQTDAQGVTSTIRTPCVGSTDINPYLSLEEETTKNYNSAIFTRNMICLALFILLIIIIIVLWVIFYPKETVDSVKIRK